MTTSLDSIDLLGGLHASRRARFVRPALERPAWPASTPERVARREVEREAPPDAGAHRLRRPEPTNEWMDAPAWPGGEAPEAAPAPVVAPPRESAPEDVTVAAPGVSGLPAQGPTLVVPLHPEGPAPAVPQDLAVAAISPRLELEESVEPPPERTLGPAELELDAVSAEWFLQGTLDPYFDRKPEGAMPWWALVVPGAAAALMIGAIVAFLAALAHAGF